MNFFRISLTLAATGLVFLTACDGTVDNQLTMLPNDSALANPAPTARPFAAQNAAHKILVGLIDSGVDYNHPRLAANMHFTLDASGKPVSLGKDFVGNDPFPAPYIVRTSTYDLEIMPSDRQESQENAANMQKIIDKAPELAQFLNPRRNAPQEAAAGAYHGTHVAGLMTYDRADFGLRAYRVLPQNKRKERDFDYITEAVENINAAIEMAATDGVKVVNMSIGVNYERATLSEDGEDKVKDFEKLARLAKTMTDTIARHPDMLFVAAAGNDGQWRDGENLMQLPCGIKLPNVLCVGALREDGTPTTFTNMTISGADVVFALGHKVLSTVPMQMCTGPSMEKLAAIGTPFGDEPETLAPKLKEECTKNVGMGVLSGTSMASPIVAHLAAEIAVEKPGLDGHGIVGEIYARAIPSFVGTVPVFKLRVRKPSWYATARASSTLGLGDDGSEFFEGVMPMGETQ